LNSQAHLPIEQSGDHDLNVLADANRFADSAADYKCHFCVLLVARSSLANRPKLSKPFFAGLSSFLVRLVHRSPADIIWAFLVIFRDRAASTSLAFWEYELAATSGLRFLLLVEPTVDRWNPLARSAEAALQSPLPCVIVGYVVALSLARFVNAGHPVIDAAYDQPEVECFWHRDRRLVYRRRGLLPQSSTFFRVFLRRRVE